MSGIPLPTLLAAAFCSGAGSNKGALNTLGTVASGVLSSPSISPGASLADGFPLPTMTSPLAGGVPPAGADFNAILNYITAFQAFVNSGGQFPFNAALALAIGGYQIGNEVQLNSGLAAVTCTTANNTTDPNTLTATQLAAGSAGWVYSGGNGATAGTPNTFALRDGNGALTGQALQVGTAVAGFASGSFYFHAVDGLTAWAKTGSTYDFSILTPSGAVAAGLLTGTNNWSFPGQVTASQFNGSGAGITGIGGQIQSVTASVAANALTAGLNPTTLTFRSATLGSGAVTNLSNGAALSLVVPSGATLGTVSGVQSTIAVLALNNAGTIVLGVVNLAGGVNLDETTLLSTTAISAGATSASTVYSAAGLTSVPFRVVGYITSTQATAGTWATAPSLVQGEGGQALAALQSFGMGQSYQNVTASRALSTTYYNTTGRPIFVYPSWSAGGNAYASFIVNGVTVGGIDLYGNTNLCGGCFVVPPGCSYSVTSSETLFTWFELR